MNTLPSPFIHLFPEHVAPDDDQLAQQIGAPFGPMYSSGQGANPRITAGFTYLGQFIDHDLSFDPTTSLDPRDNASPPMNFRTAAFDLDSLYGFGPNVNSYLYVPTDPRRFVVGGQYDDLPRLDNGMAVVGDPRSDENVILSQLVTAFLNFHNEVVDREDRSFEEAQRLVRQHYQWIVLHEYLPLIVGRSLEEILKETEGHGYPDKPLIPLEFTVAAFRFGHSQVRERYDINSNVQGKGRLVLPDLAGHKKLGRFDHVDWSFFFDLGKESQPQPSLPIQPFISPPMLNMPPEILGPIKSNFDVSVAYRDIRRGQLRKLPDPHDVADKMKLAKDQVVSRDLIWDKMKEQLTRSGSSYDPSGKPVPMWLYILFEAQELANAEHLGPMAARIVSAVFIGLLKADPESILSVPGWKPTLGTDGKFSIVDLLKMAQNQKNTATP
jgi:hypothetical protein